MSRRVLIAILVIVVFLIIGIFIAYGVMSSSGSQTVQSGQQPNTQPSAQPNTQPSTQPNTQQPAPGPLSPITTTPTPTLTPTIGPAVQPASPYASRVCEYAFTPQVMSDGGNIPLGTVAWTNLADMKQKCSQTPLCLAFVSMGYFKSSIVSDLTKDGVKVAYWTPEQGTWKQTTCK